MKILFNTFLTISSLLLLVGCGGGGGDSTGTNQAPTADSQTVFLVQSTNKMITLTGSDPEMSGLSFSVVDEPLHGTVTTGVIGGVGDHTYTPVSGYRGPDSFTFKVNDGELDSATVLVSLNILSNRELTKKIDEDANGVFDRTNTYTYDDSGNNRLTNDYITTAGTHTITTSTYDDQDRVLSTSHDADGDGRAETIDTFIYDSNHGQLLEQWKDVDADDTPDYVTLKITYNADDYAEKVEADFNGDGVWNNTYNYTYNSAGEILTEQFSSTSGNEWKITHSYNRMGYKEKTEKDDDNNGSIERVTTYSDFHATGKPMTVETDEDNDGNVDNVIKYTYNDAGKKLTDWRDTDNDSDIDSKTTWTYSDTNQVVTRKVDSENDGVDEYVQTYNYNEVDRVSRVTTVVDGVDDSITEYTY